MGREVLLDIVVVFDWVHGRTVFQIVSDAITYIMAQKGHKVHTFGDDFVAISPTRASQQVYQDFIEELSLPTNEKKRNPLPLLA